MVYTKKNTTIAYSVYGTGKNTIVILPGWGNTACTFQQIIPFFEKNYTIYIVDYPAFGESPPLKEIFTIYDYAELFKNFLEDLELTPTLLIAHSFGGRLAILLNGYLKVTFPKILLIDSAGILPRKTPRKLFRKYSYRFLKWWKWILPKNLQKKYISFLFSKYASSDYYNLPESMRKTFQNIVGEDLRKYLPTMESDVLLLWGKEDVDTPIRDANIMVKKIPNAELIVLERAGHFSYLENPYLTVKIITAFLEEES